jgi:hypothetical protein
MSFMSLIILVSANILILFRVVVKGVVLSRQVSEREWRSAHHE